MPQESWEQRRGELPDNQDLKPSAFKRDRARIIHSSEFRRLQGKMQVLDMGAGDFRRTRLTHTLEVAQIGAGIVDHIQERAPDIREALGELVPTPELLEAVCFAHDLGHPPFGHAGEVALDYAMRNHGGFEGNGYTLRLLSAPAERPLESLNLCRRTLLGTLKYPARYSVVSRHTNACGAIRPPSGWKPPKCFLDTEVPVVDWILAPFSEADRNRFSELENPGEGEHFKTRFKSLDASVMNLADDIAYGVHDLEDGVALGFITEQEWSLAEVPLNFASPPLSPERRDNLVNRLFDEKPFVRKSAVSDLVHALMVSVVVRENGDFHDGLLGMNVSLSDDAQHALDALQKLTLERVVRRFEVRSLEWRGQEIIRQLFEVCASYPHELLRKADRTRYRDAPDNNSRYRVICDYLAGMTDDYAMRIYERLFIPRHGSAFERL